MNSERMGRVELGTCRGCNRQILWVRTRKGKRMPIDPFPNGKQGNVILAGEEKIAHVFRSPEEARAYQFMHEGDGPYTSHFHTCRDAERFRKRKPAPKPIVQEPEPEEIEQLTLGGTP